MEDYMEEVGKYMNSPVLSIEIESSVQEAAQYMQAQYVGSLMVTKMGEYVGIITDTDISQKVVGKGLNPVTTGVADVMTQPAMSMDRYMPVEEADEFMRKNKIRHLAITEEDKIIGMLSVKDLVTYYAKSFQMTE